MTIALVFGVFILLVVIALVAFEIDLDDFEEENDWYPQGYKLPDE